MKNHSTPATIIENGAPPNGAALECAKAARLRYVNDSAPGIARRRRGQAFVYLDRHGKQVRDSPTLERIRSLVVPPAWRQVWICPMSDGHLQATGRDARMRKQYRYHARWRTVRDETKYDRLAGFGLALPMIRRCVDRDLDRTGLPREKVLAAMVLLLETTFIRVGNPEYERANGSYGLTTLKDRHATVAGSTIRLRFRGKSGRTHSISLRNARLARIVRRSRELPGQDLFQYVGDDESPQRLTSSDVNDYLRSTSGEDFTAKDFRTWAGTLLAARGLRAHNPSRPQSELKAAVAELVADVARSLGNTAAVCRRCYIHPSVVEALLSPETHEAWCSATDTCTLISGLDEEESALVAWLRATSRS
ncbi:MAG: DNA topoisomerase IB [Gemmatimonadota bacterium]